MASGPAHDELDMTLSDALEHWVAKHPDKVCSYHTCVLLGGPGDFSFSFSSGMRYTLYIYMLGAVFFFIFLSAGL